METKKDIGAVVKNRLEPLKDSPGDFVWNNIENELRKKKKRRTLILWLFGTGFTTLLLLLWLINPFSDSVENNSIETEIKTVDKKHETSLDRNNSTKANINNTILEAPEEINRNEQSVSEINNVNVLEHYNLNNDKHQVSNTNNNFNSTSNNKQEDNVSEILITSSSSEVNNSEIHIKEKSATTINPNNTQLTRKGSLTRSDSLIASKKKIRDSLKEQRAHKKLLLKEKFNDSIIKDDQSRWSFTPQATLSYYGALNTKTSNNFSVNYGILASYRMTKKAYLRIGVRKLNLNQTIDINSLERTVKYLEFPLEVKYTPRNLKINPYITGGLSYFKLQSESNNSLDDFEYNATMSLNLGLGLETKLFKDVYFNLESNFNYQLKPFTKKKNVKPFIFSIHTGVEYRF